MYLLRGKYLHNREKRLHMFNISVEHLDTVNYQMCSVVFGVSLCKALNLQNFYIVATRREL